MGRSIIEQVEEERLQRARDEARRSELRGKMAQWKMHGYIIARLLKAVDGEMRQAEETFSGFEQDVRRLSELQLRLNGQDVMGFPEEVLAIRQELNDPDAADDLEKKMADLEAKIKARKDEQQRLAAEKSRLEKDKRIGQYRQRIAAWRDRGYSTKRLEGALDDPAVDSAAIEKKLADLDSDIQQLLEQGKRLEAVRGSATEDELHWLDGRLLDPDAVEEVDAKVDELEQRAYRKRSDQDKRALLAGRMEEYRNKGYKVARLEGIADMPLEKAEAAMKAFEADVGSMFRMWDRLRTLNRSYFEQDWDAARAMMNDPDMVCDVEKRVGDLEKRQKAMAAQKASEAAKLAAAGGALIAEINEKMKMAVADYNPLGFYIENARWDPRLAADGLSVRAETRPGLLSKETVAVACEFVGRLAPDSFMAEAERARAAGRYVAMCYLLVHAPPEMAQLARGFSHPNLSAFVYDIGSDKLNFNEGDLKTKAFLGWFLKGSRPPGMKDAVKMIADKYGIFTRAALEQKLGLRKSEIEQVLRGWLARNEVVVVSKIKDEYSFMD
jgi:hypothetical protein